MLRIVHLGILALRYNRLDLFLDAGMLIYEFEEAYNKKHVETLKLPEGIDPKTAIGIPHPDELLREVLRWRERFRRERHSRPFMKRTESMLYKHVELGHVDRFIYEVWGCVIKGSDIELEQDQRQGRERLYWVQRLVETLGTQIARLS